MKTTHRMSLVSLIFFADPSATFAAIPKPPAFAIDWLLNNPTDSVCEAFDRRYGDGAAAKYMPRRKAVRR